MILKLKNIFRFAAITAISISSANHSSAHWNSKGPFGGSVSCMASIDTNLLIGTYEGGVFINTTGASTSWKPINQGMTSGKISAVTQLGRKIIAGTKDAGIFITNDRGNNWTPGNSGLTSLSVQALAISGRNLFAGTASGAFLSSDSGATWTAINTGLSNLNVTAIAVNGTTVYAATAGGGVFSTSNAGTSWTSINAGLSGSGLTLTSLVADGSMLYAANTNGVYMYMGSWSIFNTGLTNTHVTSLSMASGTLYATTAAGTFKSVSMGNWTAVGTGLPADTTTAVAIVGNKIFAGTKNNGIFGSTTSMINFTDANNGFNNLKTYALATLDTNTIVTATNKGIFISNDLAATYTKFNTGLTDSLNVTCLLLDGAIMKFAGTKNAGVFMSMNGAPWSALNTGLANLNVKAMTAVKGGSPMIYAATADGKVYSRTPAATTWTDVSNGLPSGIAITSLTVDGTMLYLGSNGNGVYHYMGGSWMVMNTNLTNMNVTSLAVLDGNVYAGTMGGGVYKAAMMGAWSSVNTGLPSLNILSLNAAAPYIVAGYRGGVYVTNNGGSAWVVPGVIANIPPFADVTSLSIAKTRVFAGLSNNSLYSNANSELPASTGIIELGRAKVVGKISIAPNPNAGSFRLNISLIEKARISDISLYDVTGKKVQQLSNQIDQQVTTQLSSGLYFININTDKGSLTQKVVID